MTDELGSEGGSPPPMFPFSAVVGQEDLRLALLLCAIDPKIGGVLLRGQKGSAKTTLARGLAHLLPGDAPFVELPLGASEDRLVGSIDLRAVLGGGERRFWPGLLHDADGGVLYVDEVNLLPDHLVDVLLDVAAGGVNRVEREGVSHVHPSRFVLVGSMNPEEGELRPQLLDRFGMSVDVRASSDPAQRAEAVERRMAFDADPEGFAGEWRSAEEGLRTRIASTTTAPVPRALVGRVAHLCVAAGVEGLRGDLVLCRAAGALAGWEGRDRADERDVRRVAEMALAHRRRRSPFEAPGIDDHELQSLLDEALGADPPAGDGERGEEGSREDDLEFPDAPSTRFPLLAADSGSKAAEHTGSMASGRRTTQSGPRGRLVGDRPPQAGQPLQSLAVVATVEAAAARQGRSFSQDQGPRRSRDGAPGVAGAPPGEPPVRDVVVTEPDLREPIRKQRTANLVVMAVDASGSMGGEGRMAAAKGAVLGLLVDAYQRRDRVALVTFRGDRADVVLRPTGSTEVARARLTDLPTGGRTPLAEGIDAAFRLASGVRDGAYRPLLVIVTDGRATAVPQGSELDPVAAALRAADTVRRSGMSAVVIDTEDAASVTGNLGGTQGSGAAGVPVRGATVRLGLAHRLAEAMGARHLPIAELTAGALAAAVQHQLPAS